MTYSVSLSGRAEAFLKREGSRNKGLGRQLASTLLRLEKQPRPEGSRDLGNPNGPDRIWDFGGYLISYRVDDEARTVEVGVIRASGWRAGPRP